MSVGAAVDLMRSGILEIMILSAPVLLVSMVIGLIISIFQATTSIQEQTLTFVPKVFAILLVLAVLGSWMFSSLRDYTIVLFQQISEMAR